MDLDIISERGLVLLGCGKMGSALLDGWLAQDIRPGSFTVLEPTPSDRLEALAGEGLRLNADLPSNPAVAVIAVKPQMIRGALPRLAALGSGGTVFLSIAAGTPLHVLEAALGGNTPVVRAMPNTPAAIGRGITALIANPNTDAAGRHLAEAMMGAVGQTVWLDDEAQMDAVTALSGSGPAYVFLLIEAMTDAGIAEGLSPGLALSLARATVAGAGALADSSDQPPSQLRINVTSPAGTTAAALEVLMRHGDGLPDLIRAAVAKAAARSRALGG